MPPITLTIKPNDQRPEVTRMQKALISIGATIADAELAHAGAEGRYGPTTQNAVAALRRRFGLPTEDENGDPVLDFDAPLGRLLHVAAAAEEGSSAALQTAVRESFAAIGIPPGDSSERSWLARYAVIARDFTTARKIVGPPPGTIFVISSIVNESPGQPPAPELVNPENYYTFLYDYVARSTVRQWVKEGLNPKQ